MFAVTLAAICGVFAWLLHASAQVKGSTLSAYLGGADGFWAAVVDYLGLLVVTPWPPLLALAATGGYIYFADFQPWGKRILAGGCMRWRRWRQSSSRPCCSPGTPRALATARC